MASARKKNAERIVTSANKRWTRRVPLSWKRLPDRARPGLLVQRYLRLLGVVERPESIVAMTFMRKAAAEMKERIYEALLAARDGTPSENDFDLETRKLALDSAGAGPEKILEPALRSRKTADSDHRFRQRHARAADARDLRIQW